MLYSYVVKTKSSGMRNILLVNTNEPGHMSQMMKKLSLTYTKYRILEKWY